MVRTRSQSLITRRISEGIVSQNPDQLLVEEPMTIQLDGVTITSTMRTPGHDFELAAGFCLTEGILSGAKITGIRYCGAGSPVESDFNVVTVETGGVAPLAKARLGSSTSSCGVCGVEAIEELTERLRVLPAYEPWPNELLTSLPAIAEPRQDLFGATGSSHAAAAFNREGELVLLREDIGRHNALDKVIGRLLLDGETDQLDLALFISGRASFEMVQKAWAGGFSALVAVSGASSLAVSTARRCGITMIGFARANSGTIYSPNPS